MTKRDTWEDRFDKEIKNLKFPCIATKEDYNEIKSFIQSELKSQKKDINHEWQYHLAYLTDEDVATPEGVREWVMKALEKQKKELMSGEINRGS